MVGRQRTVKLLGLKPEGTLEGMVKLFGPSYLETKNKESSYLFLPGSKFTESMALH